MRKAANSYKPTSPGRRWATAFDTSTLTPGAKPPRTLTGPLSKSGGRNNNGRITLRYRGGGHKRRFRVIDFRRDKVLV
ncbi:MAG: 50S ribosomal protein L2, partial [Deltaproteobacteria bacterium]